MKKYILFLPLLFVLPALKGQSLYFPPNSGNTWDTISPASLGWCPDKIDILYDYLENRNSKAFILLKDGKIVLEKYFGTFTQDSAWYWASAGKSLTAFTVGIAQQEGHLSISDTTSQYLGTGWTTCPQPKEDMITIRHQLTMTTGLDDGVPDPFCTDPGCLQYFADAGDRWAYHNGPYTLLDDVIASATGQNLTTYTTQKVLLPTGMTGAYIPSGYNNVFWSKPRSMARFGLLILNKGNWNGNQVMTDTAYFHDMVNTSQLLNHSYGYLWWLNGKTSFMIPQLQVVFPYMLNQSAPEDMICALGKNGQVINVVPSMDLVFIRMGNAPGDNGLVTTFFNDTIWQKLNDVMCNVGMDEENIPEVNVYPNPASENTMIHFAATEFDAELCDQSGRIIRSYLKNSGSLNIPLSGISNGVYYIRIHSSTGFLVKKLVVNRS